MRSLRTLSLPFWRGACLLGKIGVWAFFALGAVRSTTASPVQFLDVNDSGMLVGSYTSGNSTTGVLYDSSQGTYTFFNPPGAGPAGGAALGINNNGQISGQGTLAGIGSFGYILTAGSFTTFSVPGANTTHAARISGNGVVVGDAGQRDAQCIAAGDCPKTGFIYSAGNITSGISYLNASRTTLAGINESGTLAVGWADVLINQDFVEHAFLYNLNTAAFTPLAFPGAHATIAWDVNDSGEVVGVYEVGGDLFGFLYSNGVYSTIMYPGSNLTILLGISNNGTIVGGYTCATGPCSVDPPFYATRSVAGGYDFFTVSDPVPEPSTGLLLVAGLVAAVAKKSRCAG